MNAVFLDKDGTLIENLPRNVDPERIVLSFKAKDAIDALRNAGYRTILVSNQAGIAPRDLEGVRGKLESLVPLDGFYWCTHLPEDGCECRKPLPGLLLRAAREHGVDLAGSWMVGDILDDIEAGHRAGCRACLIDNGNETEWLIGEARVPDCIARDLGQAANMILRA